MAAAVGVEMKVAYLILVFKTRELFAIFVRARCRDGLPSGTFVEGDDCFLVIV